MKEEVLLTRQTIAELRNAALEAVKVDLERQLSEELEKIDIQRKILTLLKLLDRNNPVENETFSVLADLSERMADGDYDARVALIKYLTGGS